MSEIYVVVECGYEGIEKLLYASPDKEAAAKYVHDKRAKVLELRERRKGVLAAAGQSESEDLDEDAWDKALFEKQITHEEWKMGKYTDPDAYCAQVYAGEKFECCCKEIGVAADKNWFY